MENLIETVRTALRDDAAPIARRAGVVACHKILAALAASTDDAPIASGPIASGLIASAPAATTPIASAPAATTPDPSAPAATTPDPSGPEMSPATSSAPPRIDPAAVASVVALLGKLPPEQLLDMAIERLRAALPPMASVQPPGGSAQPASPLRFQLVPLQHLARTRHTK